MDGKRASKQTISLASRQTIHLTCKLLYKPVCLSPLAKMQRGFFTDCKVFSLCRYFVLDAESGQLHYFVNEQGRSQKPRGSLPLFGASVTPSDEAPHMFIVNSVNGELYKLRGERCVQIL